MEMEFGFGKARKKRWGGEVGRHDRRRGAIIAEAGTSGIVEGSARVRCSHRGVTAGMADRNTRMNGKRNAAGPAVATSPRERPDLTSAAAWYRQMAIARRFEEETERAFRRGKIGGYLHVYSGQEAVAAGFLAELRDDDIFFTAYRDHAHALFRGASANEVMAELFGKVTGLARGKGGSMHLFDVKRGFYGGVGGVGGAH